jgi:ELWxxDGT repeat protein
LFKTDGTPEGTVLVKDINPSGGSSPIYLTNVNGTLFFFASNGTQGFELWKSDGTEAGTELVKEIRAGSQGARSAVKPAVVDGVLYFAPNDGTHGYELWKSDGTEAGTVLVKDIRPGSLGPTLYLSASAGGMLFFQAEDGTHGREWWRTDGTEAGTFMLKDVRAGAASGADGSSTAAGANGVFYFVADDGTGDALWMSDGTEGGTVQVDTGEIILSNPRDLANVNGILYFSADDGIHGREPWIIAPEMAASLFYNNSTFDADAAADAEVGTGNPGLAVDKLPYYPGSGLASFENVSSFVHGINGITVDLASGHGPLTADDFTFRIGKTGAPATWAIGPSPTGISVLAGAGVAGMDRVQIVWPDGVIKNTWLEVTVEGNDAAGGFNANTGLETSKTFYFGSRIGDTGVNSSPAVFLTNAADQIAVRAHLGAAASTANRFDFDRNGVVSVADEVIARRNFGALPNIHIAGSPPAGSGSNGGSAAVAVHLALKATERAVAVAAPGAGSTASERQMAAPLEKQPAARLEGGRAPARASAGNPRSVDLALDDELLDSLVPPAAVVTQGAKAAALPPGLTRLLALRP